MTSDPLVQILLGEGFTAEEVDAISLANRLISIAVLYDLLDATQVNALMDLIDAECRPVYLARNMETPGPQEIAN